MNERIKKIEDNLLKIAEYITDKAVRDCYFTDSASEALGNVTNSLKILKELEGIEWH